MGIAQAVRSAFTQSQTPDRVVVVADNCSDNTAALARAAGAQVFESVGNTHKKAGALNQALRSLITTLSDGDIILVMDADSIISPEWIATAIPELEKPFVGAVGGIFYGAPGNGLIGMLQRLEYVRYARQLSRRKNGQAFVLTGTATAFKVRTLHAVAQARVDGVVPGRQLNQVTYYDEQNLTEDSEITPGVKTLGLFCASPMECWVATEVMPTWRQLYKQRVRWQRGALENIKAFGLTRVTLPYAARQLWSFCEFAFFLIYLTITIGSIVTGVYHTNLLWLGVGAIFMIERVLSVRPAGLKAMLLAGSMVVEMAYGLFKHLLNVKCLIDTMRRTVPNWK